MTRGAAVAVAYETFVPDPSELREGEELVLVLRDLTPGRRKYLATHARAVLSRTPYADGRSRPLTVRSMVGNVVPGPWHVTILEVLPARIPGEPYTNAFAALREAWGQTSSKT